LKEIQTHAQVELIPGLSPGGKRAQVWRGTWDQCKRNWYYCAGQGSISAGWTRTTRCEESPQERILWTDKKFWLSTGDGLKLKATSNKPQAASAKLQAW